MLSGIESGAGEERRDGGGIDAGGEDRAGVVGNRGVERERRERSSIKRLSVDDRRRTHRPLTSTKDVVVDAAPAVLPAGAAGIMLTGIA